MKTITRNVILWTIQERGRVRPHELGKEYNMSQVMVHKHLARLLKDDLIQKIGTPPRVFYGPKEQSKKASNLVT